MYLAPFVLITLFPMHLDVVRSEVLVVNSLGYIFFKEVASCGYSHTVWVLFVGSIVDHNSCIGEYPVLWDVSDSIYV